MTAPTNGILSGLPTLDYVIVDVFALTTPATDAANEGPQARPYTGNPLAVVLGGERLDTAQCQALAVEFNLSETVFALPSAVAGADYRARIFTPAGELPFAGHPSIGAAWTLAALGRLQPGLRTQECAAGLVELEIPAPDTAAPVRLTGPAPSALRPTPAVDLLTAVGLAIDDLHVVNAAAGPRIGGSGISFAFLPVRAGALTRCRPDPTALAALAGLDPELTGILVVEIGDVGAGELQIEARMFSAGRLAAAGVTEDPATGSAALGLGAWLAAAEVIAGDGTHAYAITQGADMGRPSLLSADVTLRDGAVTRVRVSGQVAVVATGRIRVP